MSDQQETTTNTNQPRLCKMGCGFFVSWNSWEKNQETAVVSSLWCGVTMTWGHSRQVESGYLRVDSLTWLTVECMRMKLKSVSLLQCVCDRSGGEVGHLTPFLGVYRVIPFSNASSTLRSLRAESVQIRLLFLFGSFIIANFRKWVTSPTDLCFAVIFLLRDDASLTHREAMPRETTVRNALDN